MTHRKIGGIHFLKIGRFGASFYVSKRKPSVAPMLERVLDIVTAVGVGLMLAIFLFLGV